MTKKETGQFLDEITVLYPSFVRNDTNMNLVLTMWDEALKRYEYKDMHEALQEYFRTDRKGYVPTAGQLIDLIDDGEDTLKPDDHEFLGW